VTCLIDPNEWEVVERYTYTPYGAVTIHAPDWTLRDTSAYNNTRLYTGREYDVETGLYHYRRRPYHAQLARFTSRDPIGYDTGDGNLYRYVHANPIVAADPMGMAPLDYRARQIQNYLDLGATRQAAAEAKLLYDIIADVGGDSWVEPFAAGLMQNWLDGAPKDPYVISAEDVKSAMLDDEAAGGGRRGNGAAALSPREQLTNQICALVKDPCDSEGSINNKPFELTATTGVYYHAFGTFTITFNGTYECDRGDCDFDGTWTFTDRYDWHKGLAANIGGTTIKDDWALLVEEYHGAKPFNETGTYVGEITLECCDDCGGGHAGLVLILLGVPWLASYIRGRRKHSDA